MRGLPQSAPSKPTGEAGAGMLSDMGGGRNVHRRAAAGAVTPSNLSSATRQGNGREILSFMGCSCAAPYSVVEPLWVVRGNLTPASRGRTKGERPWLRRSSWLHLWLSLLLPLHRLQRPKKASPTNKASPHNADPTRRTSRLRDTVRAAISRAVRYITKDQKQENMVAIRQRIAEMR
jgi:hypothetical protein